MNRKLLSLFIAVIMAVCTFAAYAAAEGNPEWMPAEWDMNADVVVVGFGPAGAMAARSAVENGASVIIVEKESREFAGGSAATSMAFKGVFEAKHLYESGLGRMTMEEAQRMYDLEDDCIQWLNEKGMEWQNSAVVGYGRGFYDAVVKAVETLDVQVLYESPAVKLISDPVNKEVHGIQCKQADGTDLFIRANKGVVLATGGYAANKTLLNRLHFADMFDYAVTGAPTQTGDGLIMAMDIGAALDGVTTQQIEWYTFSFKAASDEMGTGIVHTPPALGPYSHIFVNTKGERFMDEEMRVTHSKCQMPFLAYDGTHPVFNGYFNLPMYVIFDQAMFEGGPVGSHDGVCTYASLYGIHNWSEDNQAELERGWIVKADTIEELVEKLAAQSGNAPIDAETLKKTIETYNAGCAEQKDAFGRSEFMLDPIGEGPYYAAQIVPTIAYTIGGLCGGSNGETLDWYGNPIPRLYHAGDIGQPTKMRISALWGCMALGSIAGDACSQLTSH
ncbi:MAG: FAD-binding protein [Clostridia bacterium]|nr:FAD-binding protein [Clostridia bacterium]